MILKIKYSSEAGKFARQVLGLKLNCSKIIRSDDLIRLAFLKRDLQFHEKLIKQGTDFYPVFYTGKDRTYFTLKINNI